MPSDMHLLRKVDIFDTTLRDGEQSPGCSMSIEQKVELAEVVERLGVNRIEAGFPISSTVDFEATREICRTLKTAKPSGFARTARADIDACAQAMADAVDPIIQFASIGSDIHIRYRRRVSRQQVLDEMIDALDYARSVGFTEIYLGFEDSTRGDTDFMKRLIEEGLARGATTIVLPDTVGGCLPEEYRSLVAEVRSFVGDQVPISIHCHDDMGLAVANSVAGIQGGADEVQATLCGIGERAGNCALEELVAILNTKQAVLHRTHDVVTHRLYEACMALARAIQLDVAPHKAILGRNAFSTEAGMHQQGVLRHRFTYEWLRAEDYGARPRVAVGRHSGRTIIREHLRAQGIRDLDEVAVDEVYQALATDMGCREYPDPDALASRYRAALASRRVGEPVEPSAPAKPNGTSRGA